MEHKINAIRVKLVIFLGLVASLPIFIGNYSLTKHLEGNNVRVLDGDTIVVQGQKVRLYGLDAPELKQSSFDGIKIGIMSRDYLRELLRGRWVSVSYNGRGYYGRIIGTVFVGKRNINLEILRSGMAIFSRYTKRKDYYLAGFLARLKRRGIFKTSGFLNPSEFRRKKSRD